jgi:hypothetical protein
MEYIPPNVVRAINRTRQGVYSDTQSVHNHSIQEGVKSSIHYIISIKPMDGIIEKLLTNEILTEKTKRLLMEYINDKEVHSVANVTFEEVFNSAFTAMLAHPNSAELLKIMNDEMTDAECKCFTGRLSRLVNCLNGFDDRVIIHISDSEQIGNIIAVIKEKMGDGYTVEKHIAAVKNELKERGYSKEIIEEWSSYIE